MSRKQPETQKPTFVELINLWLDACRIDGLSPRTIQDYSDKVPKFAWWWDIHTGYGKKLGSHPHFVTVKEAREFAAYLRTPQKDRWGKQNTKELSPASVVSYGLTIKVFFSWLEREGYIEQNPFNKSVHFSNRHKKDTVIKNVSPDQITSLFKELTNPERIKTFTGKRDLAMVSLLLDSGIRRGELLSLQIEDLDLARLRCTIRGKTGQRWAYFSERCKTVLQDYLKVRKTLDAALWLTADGVPVGISCFNTLIRRIRERSGVDFHAHQLRHTFALMMSDKVSAFELRDLMGHTNISTTQIYVQRNPDRLSNLHRPSSPLNTLEQLPSLKRQGRPRKWK